MNVFDISKLVLFLLYYKNIVFSNAIIMRFHVGLFWSLLEFTSVTSSSKIYNDKNVWITANSLYSEAHLNWSIFVAGCPVRTVGDVCVWACAWGDAVSAKNVAGRDGDGGSVLTGYSLCSVYLNVQYRY